MAASWAKMARTISSKLLMKKMNIPVLCHLETSSLDFVAFLVPLYYSHCILESSHGGLVPMCFSLKAASDCL